MFTELAARGKPSTLFPRERLVQLAGATNEATMKIGKCSWTHTQPCPRMDTARRCNDGAKIEKPKNPSLRQISMKFII